MPYVLLALVGALLYRYRGGGFTPAGVKAKTFRRRLAWCAGVAVLFTGSTANAWVGLGAGLGAYLALMLSHGEYYDMGINPPGSTEHKTRWLEPVLFGLKDQFLHDFTAMFLIGLLRSGVTILFAFIAAALDNDFLSPVRHAPITLWWALGAAHALAYAAGRGLYKTELWIRATLRLPYGYDVAWFKFTVAGEYIYGAAFVLLVATVL